MAAAWGAQRALVRATLILLAVGTVLAVGAPAVAAPLDVTTYRVNGMLPQGITAGPDGAIWFTERYQPSASEHYIIGRIDSAGHITHFRGESPGPPLAIAAGPDGNLWFTTGSYQEPSIGRITLDGHITTFPIPTKSAEPFVIVAGPDGSMWFVEGDAGRIGRITPAGVVTEFPAPPGGRSYPLALVAGTDGKLWYADVQRGVVASVTTAGSIEEFPLPTPQTFVGDLTAAPDGNVWFVEERPDQVGLITRTGQVTEFPIPNPHGRMSLSLGANGAVWFPDIATDPPPQIKRISVWSHAYKAVPFRDAEFSNPRIHDMTSGLDGDLWMTDPGIDGIVRMEVPSKIQRTLRIDKQGTGSGSVSTLDGRLTCPAGPDQCSSSYPLGSIAVLKATPAPGSTFAGWKGGCFASYQDTCLVRNIVSATTVRPQFDPPQLSIADAGVTEPASGSTVATLTVSLSHASADPVTVHFSTQDGTAVAPGDYKARDDVTLTFPPGRLQQPANVRVDADALHEGDETLQVILSDPSGASIADGTGTLTIHDGTP